MKYLGGISDPKDLVNKEYVDISGSKIPFGEVDSTSTSTAYTATVDGITALEDGVCCYLMNGVVTSASGFTININGLGAKPVYGTLAAATQSTTIFNINYTMLFVYNSKRVSGGCWDVFYGYNSDTTTGREEYYYLRPYAGQAIYRYKFLMEGEDGRFYPITTTNQSSATQVTKSPTTTPLRPWKIWYYTGTATVNAGAAFAAQTVQPSYYATTAVYNFNASTGTYAYIFLQGSYNKDTDLFTLDSGSNYYKFVKYTAAIDWSANLTQGKYYILLGSSYSTTNYFQLFNINPFYYFDGTRLIPVERKVTKDLIADINVPTKVSDLTNDVGYITGYTETDPTVPSWAKASSKPTYTASEVGALPITGGTLTGNTDLNGGDKIFGLTAPAATNSPILRFQRGELTDNYNDWQIQDRGGYLYFDERGSGSTAWTNRVYFDTAGVVHASSYTGSGASLTGVIHSETDPIFSASAASGISSTDITNWNGKQAALVSGTNIKTINNESLLGSGNINIQGGSGGAVSGVKGNAESTYRTGDVNLTTENIGAVADCTLSIRAWTSGNPRVVKFCTVNYNGTDSNNGVFIKISMRSGHGNGTAYNIWQDAVLSVGYQGSVTVNVFRYYADSITYESVAHNYGDILYTVDTTNKVVKFYVLMGQYSYLYQSPLLRLNASTAGTITQHTGDAIMDMSGTHTYANVFWLDGSTKQDKLVSGTNIKTINSASILGSGDISVYDSAHTINTNSTCLPQFSGSPNYLVGIEAFADGGAMKWQSASAVSVGYASSAGTATDNTKLPLTGGTLSGALTINSTINCNAFYTDSNNYLYTNSWLKIGTTSDQPSWTDLWVNHNGWLYKRAKESILSDIGGVPTSRTVNGNALNSNITLTASDVGAQPTITSSTDLFIRAFKATAISGAPFKVVSHSISVAAISSGGSSGAKTVTFTTDGGASLAKYHPLGIIGYRTGTSNGIFTRIQVTSYGQGTCTVTYNMRAIAAVSACTGYIDILWMQSTV